jgi:hypothetical protein
VTGLAVFVGLFLLIGGLADAQYERSRRKDAERDAAKAWGIVAELKDDAEVRRVELTLSRDLAAKQTARADRLCLQVWELQEREANRG